jgi:hypothetical protein
MPPDAPLRTWEAHLCVPHGTEPQWLDAGYTISRYREGDHHARHSAGIAVREIEPTKETDDAG